MGSPSSSSGIHHLLPRTLDAPRYPSSSSSSSHQEHQHKEDDQVPNTSPRTRNANCSSCLSLLPSQKIRAPDTMRRVSWGDHRKDLFPLQEHHEKEHSQDDENPRCTAESDDKSSVDEEVTSVSSSSGGWKADYTSHFKGPSSSSSTSSRHPRTSPASSALAIPTKLVPTDPEAPNIRSATPTPRSTTKNSQPPYEGAWSEHRFMECSCCCRKNKNHLSLQLGVERELEVENPPTIKKPVHLKALDGPPKKKPPMRFGTGPVKSDILNKAAAMNLENKAKFTVLPVVTLSKSQREMPVRPKRKPNEPTFVRTKPDHEYKRGCATVFPKPGSSCCQGRRSVTTPELPLATPSLNSTGHLLERLEEVRHERFDPRAALQREDIRLTTTHSHCSHADLVQRYKDLCGIVCL